MQLVVLQTPSVLGICSVIYAASGVLRHTVWQGEFKPDATVGPAVASTLVATSCDTMLVATWRDIYYERKTTHDAYVLFRSIAEQDSSWECSMLKPGASSCRSSASDWGSLVRRRELLQDMLRRTLGTDLQVGSAQL